MDLQPCALQYVISLFDFVLAIPLCVACSVHEGPHWVLSAEGGSPLENRHENGPRHARTLAAPVPVRGTVFESIT